MTSTPRVVSGLEEKFISATGTFPVAPCLQKR